MIKKLIKIFLIFSYSLILAEIFLRILHPIPILPRYVSATDYGIRGNTPNVSYQHVSPEYRVLIKINSQGIRENNFINYEKEPGTLRIVTLGDSFMLGYGANYDQTFIYQMKNYIHQNKVEVINLGVSGHGTAEELLALKYLGLKFKPDIVLLSWHGTDYSDNTRSNLFKLMDDHLVKSADTFLPAVKLREYLFSFRLYEIIATNSQLYSWLREVVSELVKNLYQTVNSILTSQQSISSAKGDFENKDKTNQSKKLAIALLLEVQQITKNSGAKLVIVDIPRKRSRDSFWSTFPIDPLLSEIPIYYPIEDFKKYKGEMLYWEKSDGHFTPKGNKIVGEGIANLINELGYTY